MFPKRPFILILLQIIFITKAQRASYNEPCGDKIRCDARKSLTCISNTCQCIKPNEMKYEAEQDKCVVLPGERCSYKTMEYFNESQTLQEKSWTLSCITNTTCRRGFCECRFDQYINSENICSPRQFYGQNCSRNDQCSFSNTVDLVCDSGVCTCNKSNSVWDPKNKQCAGLVGTKCHRITAKWLCVPNAECYSSPDNYKGICMCAFGYQASKQGLCEGSYDAACSSTMPCMGNFSCVEGRCECPFPNHQYYDTASSQCISYVRGPCREIFPDGVRNSSCVSNAYCTNSSGIFECTCDKGMVESLNRECKLGYGETCESSKVCDDVGLVCRNGTCSCQKDFHVYDTENKKCVGLVGAQCENSVDCVSGAFCDEYRDPEMKKGTCRCSKQFETNPDRCCTPIQNALAVEIIKLNRTVSFV